MGAINFTKGKYGTTIIMDGYTNPEIYEEYNGDEYMILDRIETLYADFNDEIDSINSKISQNLDKYEDFMNGYNLIHITITPGYYDGFSAYIDNHKSPYMERNSYKTDEEYKNALIDYYVDEAEQWRDNYVCIKTNDQGVDIEFTDKDFDKLLDEYRQDLNIAFNQIEYDLIKIGQDYSMSILDQNGWVTKDHKITDKDVEIAKAKLDNAISKNIDDVLER